MFQLMHTDESLDDLQRLRAFDQKKAIDRIEEQLPHQANVPSRNRKRLTAFKSPWVFTGEAWELRVGELRVFYDVDVKENIVMIRGVRNKPPHQTTEAIV